MLYGQIEEHASWIAVASMAIGAASLAWNGWLTYLNAKLRVTQQENGQRIDEAKKENEKRDNRTDNRVDLWARSNLRRGAASAVNQQMAESKGGDMLAIKVTDPQVRAAYAPIAPLLKELRKQYPDVVAFTEEVLKRYGKWIEEHICDVLGIHDYECMAMAVSVSEEATAEHKAI